MLDITDYSVVEMQWFSAIVNQDVGSLTKPTLKYFLKIEVPPIVLKGVPQVIPATIRRSFVIGEPLQLFLIPSDFTVPTLKYKVSIYKELVKEPILVEDWVVPQPLNHSRFSLTLKDNQTAYDLPANFWQLKELVSTLSLPNYTVQQTKLVFDIPPSNVEVSGTYTGKYTRADVIWVKD